MYEASPRSCKRQLTLPEAFLRVLSYRGDRPGSNKAHRGVSRLVAELGYPQMRVDELNHSMSTRTPYDKQGAF